jgi:hypothetical protein
MCKRRWPFTSEQQCQPRATGSKYKCHGSWCSEAETSGRCDVSEAGPQRLFYIDIFVMAAIKPVGGVLSLGIP